VLNFDSKLSLFFGCDSAGDNGDRGGDKCCLWSSVIYGDMCHSGGNILWTSVAASHYRRHYVGYDQTVTHKRLVHEDTY